MNKTAGIFCDNYKLDKFKEKLDEAKFEYSVTPSKEIKNASVIKVKFNTKRFNELSTLVNKINRSFK